MDALLVVVLNGIVVFIVYQMYRPKKPSTQNAQYNWVDPNLPGERIGNSQKRKEFVELYNAKDWQGIVSAFDGYDFDQHLDGYTDYQGMGMAWFKLGDTEKAEQYFNKAMKSYRSAGSAAAQLNLAILYKESDNWAKAIEWVQKANPSELRADKNMSEFYIAMRVGAECFKNLGLISEGINFLKIAPTSARIIDKDLADVFEWLGQLYEIDGQYAKALKSYQKVVTIRYDKDVNAKILELNQMVYEAEKEKDDRKAKRESKKKGSGFEGF